MTCTCSRLVRITLQIEVSIEMPQAVRWLLNIVAGEHWRLEMGFEFGIRKHRIRNGYDQR